MVRENQEFIKQILRLVVWRGVRPRTVAGDGRQAEAGWGGVVRPHTTCGHAVHLSMCYSVAISEQRIDR